MSRRRIWQSTERPPPCSIPNPSLPSAFIRSARGGARARGVEREGRCDTIDMHAAQRRRGSCLLGAELPFWPVFELLQRHGMTESFCPRGHETSGTAWCGLLIRERGKTSIASTCDLPLSLPSQPRSCVIKRLSGEFGEGRWPFSRFQ